MGGCDEPRSRWEQKRVFTVFHRFRPFLLVPLIRSRSAYQALGAPHRCSRRQKTVKTAKTVSTVSDSELLFTPAVKAAALIRARKLSPVEYVDAVLNAVDKAQPKLNC